MSDRHWRRSYRLGALPPISGGEKPLAADAIKKALTGLGEYPEIGWPYPQAPGLRESR